MTSKPSRMPLPKRLESSCLALGRADAFGTARCARFAPPSSPLRSSFALTPLRSGALARSTRSGCVGWCGLVREGGEE